MVTVSTTMRWPGGRACAVLGLLLVLAGCGHSCMSEKDKLAMLNAIPDKPRFMAFVLRSYTGSRQHLLIAAREMLTASALDGDPKKSGSAWLSSYVRGAPDEGRWVSCAATMYLHPNTSRRRLPVHRCGSPKPRRRLRWMSGPTPGRGRRYW
jgi:hypothetical protein